jgi:hypothetical protein
MARLLVGILVSLAVGCSNRPLAFPGGDNGLGGPGGSGASGGSGSGSGSSSGGGSGSGSGGSGGAQAPAPRLIAPLSTARVTSRRPRLRWDLGGAAAAATVELCADRGCSQSLGSATVDASGAAATPDGELPSGVVFWRVHAGGQMSATWELFVGKRSAPVDTSYGAILDLDGDGVPDVAASTKSGGVAIYFGGAAGLMRAPLVIANPDGAKASFGYQVIAAGDLDGDGFGDLAVGECDPKGSRVHVYFGAGGGAATSRTQALDSPDGMSGFGCRLAAAGDLDGDGFADLAVARVGLDFSGGLYIYRGGAGGLPATAPRIDSPDYHPSRLGYSLAGIGDIDGDGFDDLAATEIDYSALSGRLHVYFGGPGGISNQHQVTLLSPDPSGLQFGASVASAGDLDGDGHPDLVVASPAVSATKVPPKAHVYLGGPGAIKSGVVGLDSEVEGAGDLDGDGYDDLVASSPDQLVAFFGRAGGIAPDGVSVAAAGQGTNPRHLASAGDLDGDGMSDLLVGDGAGLELFLGGAGGLDRARLIAVTPPGGAGGAVCRVSRPRKPRRIAKPAVRSFASRARRGALETRLRATPIVVFSRAFLGGGASLARSL